MKKMTKKIVKKSAVKKVSKKPAKKVAKKLTVRKPGVSKKARTSTIHHVVILDKSGSMTSVHGPTISGFNENAGNIRKLDSSNPDQKHTVTLVTFSSENENVSWLQPANSIQDLTAENYSPNGNTALCDAIGRTIVRLKDEIEKTASDSSPVGVLVTIITDGEENASREYTAATVSSLIESLKGNPNLVWTITYMGANQDVMAAAKKYNISASNVASYTSSAKGTKSAFSNLSNSRDSFSRGFACKVDSGEAIVGSSMNFFSADANTPADFTQDADKTNPVKAFDPNQTILPPTSVKSSSNPNNKTT